MRQRLHTVEDTDEQIHKVKSEILSTRASVEALHDLGVALPVHECSANQDAPASHPLGFYGSFIVQAYLIKSLAISN